MAINFWTGSTNDDWATDTNWSLSAVPVADDEIIFDARFKVLTGKPTTGMGDTGANESGHADNATLDLLHFKKGYTVGIGTSALPLVTSPDKIIIEGTGDYHICVGVTNQSTDTTVGTVIVNNKDANVYLYSNCNDGANVADFTNVYLLAGDLVLAFYAPDGGDAQGCSVTNLYIVPNKASDATCVIKKDAYDVLNTTFTNIYMKNGTLTTDSGITTLELYNGTVNYGTDLVGSPEADLNITTLRQYGGTFYWLPDDSGDPTIATAHIIGGTFDASSSTNNDRSKTILVLNTYENAIVNLANNKSTIAVNDWRNFGADITVDRGSKLTLAYDQS